MAKHISYESSVLCRHLFSNFISEVYAWIPIVLLKQEADEKNLISDKPPAKKEETKYVKKEKTTEEKIFRTKSAGKGKQAI